MANFTKDGNQTTTQECLCTIGLGVNQKILLITTNIPLSIVTFLGNVLIIFALKKVTSLRPPSKVLLGCLAATDLGVGLVTQPLRMGYIMSPEHSKRCYYLKTPLREYRYNFLRSICVHFHCVKCRQTSRPRFKIQTSCSVEKSMVLGCYCLDFEHYSRVSRDL